MLSENEMLILKDIRKNARVSLIDVSRKLCIPNTTVFMKKKKVDKYINKYTVILDYHRLGYPIRTLFVLKNVNEKTLFFLYNHKSTNNLQKALYGGGFILEALFSSLKYFEKFKEQLEYCNTKIVSEYQIVEEIKKEDFLG